jgi:uncharacterized membrane protein YhfC
MFEILASMFTGSMIKAVNTRGIELPDYIDFGSGIFAAFLLALSLIAYRNVKSKRLLFVSTAFGLFSLRALVTRLDLLIPEAQSATIELALALSGFCILGLFFIAIVKRDSKQ